MAEEPVGGLRRGAQVEEEQKREVLECERSAKRGGDLFCSLSGVVYMNISNLRKAKGER